MKSSVHFSLLIGIQNVLINNTDPVVSSVDTVDNEVLAPSFISPKPSSRWILGRMNGSFAAKIFTDADKEHFKLHWRRFLRRDGNGRSFIDFDLFCSYWNFASCHCGITRKTSKHLAEYYKVYTYSLNAKATLRGDGSANGFQEHSDLKKKLRKTNDFDSQGFIQSRGVDRTSGIPTNVPEEGRPEVHLPIKSGKVPMKQSIFANIPRKRSSEMFVTTNSGDPTLKKTRREKVCGTCGHFKGAFSDQHIFFGSTLRCSNSVLRCNWSAKSHAELLKKRRNFYNPCDCFVCHKYLYGKASRSKGLLSEHETLSVENWMFDCSDTKIFHVQSMNLDMTAKDFRTCLPSRWINDEVQCFYMFLQILSQSLCCR